MIVLAPNKHILRKEKQDEKPFSPETSRVVIMMSIVLLLIGFFGLTRIYTQGERCLNSMSIGERWRMSITFDPELEDYEHNEVEIEPSVYGKILTADGKELFGVRNRQNPGAAYGGLLGKVDTIDVPGTQYVMNLYKDKLFPAARYDAMTGIMASPNRLDLTIDSRIQENIYRFLMENDVIGSVAAFDFRSGDVIALVSAPGFGTDQPHSYINKGIYPQTPGSVQKLLTLFLLCEQGLDPSHTFYTCAGRYKLPDGNTVVCTGTHGNIPGNLAIGYSCNCWFAQAISHLDINRAKNVLREMGFSVNGEAAELNLGRLPLTPSSMQIGDAWDFNSVWALIGQSTAMENPITMLTLCGNLITGGNTALPRLTLDEPVTYSPFGQKYASAFDEAMGVWKLGYQVYNGFCDEITVCKTGTADQLADGHTHRSMAVVCENLGVCFYVTVENNEMLPYTLLQNLTNYCAEQIAAVQQKEEG